MLLNPPGSLALQASYSALEWSVTSSYSLAICDKICWEPNISEATHYEYIMFCDNIFALL